MILNMDKQKLQEELKQAMLAKDELKTSVLRLLLSSINYCEIEKGKAGYQATDDDVLTVIQREIKQRKDSIEHFESARRQELVDKEKKELEILQAYLPQQLSEEEVKNIVEQTISEVGASSITDMGKVMGALNAKLKGKTDMGIVSSLVKSSLSPTS